MPPPEPPAAPPDPNADLTVLRPYCRTIYRMAEQVPRFTSDPSTMGRNIDQLRRLERLAPPYVVWEWDLVNRALGKAMRRLSDAGAPLHGLDDPQALPRDLMGREAVRRLERLTGRLHRFEFSNAVDGIEAHALLWCGIELDPEASV